ncbi:MAG: hypothetical protein PHQ68_09455 [Parabacteroides sp.]|nr:hypothetical protein [Parabacteroides sp.]
MAKITSEIAYKATMERIEELLPLVDDNTPLDNRNLIELELLSNLVVDYEDEHYPIKTPSLLEVLKLRMYEMKLNQNKLYRLRHCTGCLTRFWEYKLRTKKSDTHGPDSPNFISTLNTIQKQTLDLFSNRCKDSYLSKTKRLF